MSEQYPHYIDFRHVYKTFDTPVLVDVNFHVDAGQTVAIIGRSGVGKSVTLSHIMGFLKPDDGRVIAAHEDITDWTEAELRRLHRKVTMVFQSGALFDSLTVSQNFGTFILPTCPPVTKGRSPSPGLWQHSPSAFCTTSRPQW
jgi:phospholipid/cholesterol/gamma-HCH transport system ATP-binding protein